MPGRLTNEELHDVLTNALQSDGWTAYMPDQVVRDVFVLSAIRGNESFQVAVRIYSLTDDTRKRGIDTDRLKIQTTGHPAPHPTLPTALLGANFLGGDLVFAGFDVNRHLPAVAESNNIQIQEETLYAALRSTTGYEIQTKENGELVVGIAPPYLAGYLRNPGFLHAHPNPAPPVTMAPPPPLANRRLVQTFTTARDPRFPLLVLAAYGGQCAMCSLQMGLPEAAHIKPVRLANDDRINNGIPICPNHHEAFDRLNLVAIDATGRIMVNKSRYQRLSRERRLRGVDMLLGSLHDVLITPIDPANAPDPECLTYRFDLDTRGQGGDWISVEEARALNLF